MLDLLDAQVNAWGIKLETRARRGLIKFARILASYDRANVIGTRDLDRILLDHVLDSLSCLLFGPALKASRIADVGSGGGLPGIPIQIAHPRASTVLFESTGKKVDFLRYALEELGLSKTQVVRARVEEAGHLSAHRSGYDVCTARAVARLSVVAEYCVPFVRVGGHVISMKGRPDDDEIEEGERAAEMLGARVAEVIEVPFLPEVSEKERRLVILEKVRETPARYPRKPGTPVRSPLGREENGR